MWDASQSCANGSCTTANQTVGSQFSTYQDMTSASAAISISGRSVLTEVVTDFLVSRGNHQVVASTVGNRGAKFSTSGMSTLVTRAQDDDDLALRIWSRPDISRHDLVKLFAQAQRAAWELH